MQAKKSTKILSALSMATLSVIGAKTSHGATLNLYYGQDPLIANSNNGIIIGSGYNKVGIGLDTVGSRKFITGATEQTVSQTGTTTITLPVGDYLSLAIDALLTGNSNADGGLDSGNGVQPSFLGLSELSLAIQSTDASASILTPVTADAAASPLSSFNGHNTYHSTTVLNTSVVSQTAKTVSLGPNSAASSAYQVKPAWGSVASLDPRADVQPNEPTYDPGAGNGNVGLNGFTTGGNTAVDTTSARGIANIEQFASSTNTANYNSATDYYDSLIFQGLTDGTVTLTPTVIRAGSSYWVNTGRGTAGTSSAPGTASTYGTHTMTAADTVNNAPKLVIVVGISLQPGHAIVALEATADSNYGTTITNGIGASQGTFNPASPNTLSLASHSAGNYQVAQVTGISTNAGAATGNVNVSGWNPASDPEIFGIDVRVNGTNATPSQLATLIAAISGTGPPASTGVSASTTDPTGGALSTLQDTGTTSYNLFLTFAAGGPGAADNLNLDFSNANDAALVGYTFSAVSVVPEPVSLGLLAIGGLGLMSRRTRRKS
jgi:hypothetical protein